MAGGLGCRRSGSGERCGPRVTTGVRVRFRHDAMMRDGIERTTAGRCASQEEHRIGAAAPAWLPNGP